MISITDELAPYILAVVAQIPYGCVASYAQVARLSGFPKHARLVGKVLQQLDSESDVPWHRVINAQGKISLKKMNEQGENIQRNKLINEGVLVIQDKISLKAYQWDGNVEYSKIKG